jgi:hypothetical protein
VSQALLPTWTRVVIDVGEGVRLDDVDAADRVGVAESVGGMIRLGIHRQVVAGRDFRAGRDQYFARVVVIDSGQRLSAAGSADVAVGRIGIELRVRRGADRHVAAGVDCGAAGALGDRDAGLGRGGDGCLATLETEEDGARPSAPAWEIPLPLLSGLVTPEIAFSVTS